MNSKKIIGFLIFIFIISIIFFMGYSSKKQVIEKQAIYWSFKNDNVENEEINLSNEKIMPGSKGNFKIEIDASDIETDMEYKITIKEEKNIPKNLKFIAEIEDEQGNCLLKTKEYETFSKLAEEELNGKIMLSEKNRKRYINIFWNWNFETELEDFEYQIVNAEDEESLKCYYKIEIEGYQLEKQ